MTHQGSGKLMLDQRLIDFLRKQNWWHEEESAEYKKALGALGISEQSDFGKFLLHAEDGPNFAWKSDTFHQLCWHALNTNYLMRFSDITRNVFEIPGELVQFSSLEGGGTYLYDPSTGVIYLAQLGKSESVSGMRNVSKRWESFNSFALDFFDLSD
jgi:hypothetical protein